MKELVVISPHLRTPTSPGKSPSIQFPSETGKLGMFEVARHDVHGEFAFLENDKSLSVGEPRDDIVYVGVGEDFH